MPETLKCKWRGLMGWLLILLFAIPTGVYAGRGMGGSSEILTNYSALLLLVAVMGGGFTASRITTAVDGQMLQPMFSKIFTGILFGTFASIFVSSKYGLSDLEMLLPAYLLAAIGAPVMVYVLSIAADKDTYLTIWRWIKQRFGVKEQL